MGDDMPADSLEFAIDGDSDVGGCSAFWRVVNWNKPYRLLDPGSIAALRGHVPFVHALNCVYLLGGRDPEHNCWFLAACRRLRVLWRITSCRTRMAQFTQSETIALVKDPCDGDRTGMVSNFRWWGWAA